MPARGTCADPDFGRPICRARNATRAHHEPRETQAAALLALSAMSSTTRTSGCGCSAASSRTPTTLSVLRPRWIVSPARQFGTPAFSVDGSAGSPVRRLEREGGSEAPARVDQRLVLAELGFRALRAEEGDLRWLVTCEPCLPAVLVGRHPGPLALGALRDQRALRTHSPSLRPRSGGQLSLPDGPLNLRRTCVTKGFCGRGAICGPGSERALRAYAERARRPPIPLPCRPQRAL
jgi:hypothetical protein